MLNLDPATIIFQIVNFVVLAALLYRLLFQPVLRKSAQRAAEREQLARELSEERENVAALRAELERAQARVEEEAQSITAEARAHAEAERQELLGQVQTEAERVLAEMQADAVRLRQQALDESREQVVDAILEISGSVIHRVAPPAVHDDLVAGLSERIREMGLAEMQRVEAIRRSLGSREPVAHITSARELSTEQQGQLAQILTALADRHVTMEMHADPNLVAGIRVRLGDTVMDSSIAGQLSELRAHVSAALAEQDSSV